MSQSFVKRPAEGSHSALFGLGILTSEQPRPPCTVCGTPCEKHGTYPTCATHPYTADGHCGAVGTVERGQFTGLPCPGAECVNGCVGAAGAHDSTGAMAAAWFGTPGAEAAIERVFGKGRDGVGGTAEQTRKGDQQP